MRLVDLEPQFLRCETQAIFHHVESLKEAHGVGFQCPKCLVKNGGPEGTHYVLVWFRERGTPLEVEPKARWIASGKSYDDLTLSPSVRLLPPSCEWHGSIENGEVRTIP